MLLQPRIILRTDTEPAMILLRRKSQLIRKMNNLTTELQDTSPDVHEGLQVERWVQTVRNLAQTLVYEVEKQVCAKITSESTLYPWSARHASFLLNRFVVHGGQTAFELVFERPYKGALVPWGSVVIGRPLPKLKEKGERWIKGVFVGKDAMSNANLISTSRGIVKTRTIRKCSPEFQVEALINAVGTPWDYKQSTLPARQITKRIPPHRGIEVAPQALENLGSDYSPSQVAASDPDSHHIGEQEEQDGRMEEEDEKNEDEDPGEGIGSRSISSMSGVESDHPSNVQVPSEGMTSEELMADGDGRPVESKRAQGSTAMDPLPEPPHARLRTDEPSSQEHMMRRLCRDDVVRRVMVLRTVKEIDSFLKKEFPRYQDDEEVDLAEFGEIEAEIGEDCDGESYGDFGNNDDEEEEE